MTGDQKKEASIQDSGTPQTDQSETERSEAAAAEGTEAAIESLKQDFEASANAGEETAADPAAALEAEVASLKDQLLRAMAGTENVRSRARREREDGVKYAAIPLIRDLLGFDQQLMESIMLKKGPIRSPSFHSIVLVQ